MHCIWSRDEDHVAWWASCGETVDTGDLSTSVLLTAKYCLFCGWLIHVVLDDSEEV